MTVSTERAVVVPGAERVRGGLREIADLAYPVVLTQMSATAMGVVDSAMVGRLGATQLAAVGFASVWMWTIFSFFHGTVSGVQTFVSQHDGAGEPRLCGRWTWQALYGAMPVAVGCALLLAPCVGFLIAAASPSAELQSAATGYSLARLPGDVAFVAVMALTSFFRGVGDTRTPLYVTLFANAVNAVLDYGLIFGELGFPALGATGAGAATTLAESSAAVLLYAAFRRRAISERYATARVAPDRAAVRRFLRTGLPIGGQWFIGMTSFAIFTTFVARMGDAPMAASQAFLMLLSLSFMQAVGISIAAQTLVGRYVGARDVAAVQRSFRAALGLGIAVGGAVALLFVSIPGPLLRIFTDDPAVVALGRPLLLLGAMFQVCDAVQIITQGALRGAGDTRFPFLVETAFGWGVFLPLAWFLGAVCGYGLTGAWLGGTFSLLASACVLTLRFRSGAWQEIRI
jgi:MATE family multidrug resistance protein